MHKYIILLTIKYNDKVLITVITTLIMTMKSTTIMMMILAEIPLACFENQWRGQGSRHRGHIEKASDKQKSSQRQGVLCTFTYSLLSCCLPLNSCVNPATSSSQNGGGSCAPVATSMLKINVMIQKLSLEKVSTACVKIIFGFILARICIKCRNHDRQF